MPETASQILKQQKIRQTDCRRGVLEEFVEKGHALSQPDLEKALGTNYDRVTIYRTLSLFLDKGLIHKVLDDAGVMKYALCAETCSDEEHRHEHVHFKCIRCGLTTCFEEIELPHFRLPEGYSVQESNLLLQGICKECREAGIPN